MEVKCRVCGGETIQEDGICRPCALFRKDEVAALLESGRQKIKSAAKTHGGVEMEVKDYDSHRKCSTEGCFKYAVKEGMCIRCFNGAHGIKTRIGRKPKSKRGRPVIPVTSDCHSSLAGIILKKDAGQASMTKNKKSNDEYEGVMLKLITAKSEYQKKVAEIDSAIEVLRKYA